MTDLKKYLCFSSGCYSEKVALEIEELVYTYQQVYDLACNFSNGLYENNICLGSKVVIYLPKVTEAYISIFGVIEHSSTYIPIDIHTPIDRLEYIVNDSEANVLICRDTDYEKVLEMQSMSLKLIVLVAFKENKIVPLEEKYLYWDELIKSKNLSASYLNMEASENDIAYILYTSGSTGFPKGAAISHKAASAFIDWACSSTELSIYDRIANHAPLGFDLSVYDIFCAIKVGATLVPVPSWPAKSGYPFARFICEKKLSVWYSVPTILYRIIESHDRNPINLSSLRLVIFAGEPFNKKKLIRLNKIIPDAKLYNWYGSTEINSCIYHMITPKDLSNDDPIPIGIPSPFTKTKILYDVDDSEGELLISGDSLMSGYLLNGQINTEVFIKDLKSGCLYYPTGDIVKVANNLLYFVGRRDFRVKRHGYRVELREIEECVLAISSVNEVVALQEKNKLGLFVAFDKDSRLLNERKITSYLAGKLPSYMRPDAIFIVSAIPKNDRGKIDRKYLIDILVSHNNI